MFCPKCGKELIDGALFCPDCGGEIPKVALPNKEAPAIPDVRNYTYPLRETVPGLPPYDEKPKTNKKKIILISAAAAALVALVVVFFTVLLPLIRYNGAVSDLEEGRVKEAREEFRAMGDYKDSYAYLNSIKAVPEVTVITEQGGSSTSSKESYTINDKGYVSRIEYRSSDSYSKSSDQYEYDDDGNVIKSVAEYSGGAKWITENKYDEHGNKTYSIFYTEGGEGDYSSETTFDNTYDNDGNLIKTVQKPKDSDRAIAREYEYDRSGNLIKEVSTDTEYEKDGTKRESKYIYEYEYDNGMMIASKATSIYNGNTSTSKNEITYDSNGRIERVKNTKRNENSTEAVEQVFSYNDLGKISEIKNLLADGTSSKTVISYDEDEKIVETVYTRSDGAKETTRFEYDSDGNLAKKTVNDSEGKTTVYEYEDYVYYREKVENLTDYQKQVFKDYYYLIDSSFSYIFDFEN